MTIIQRYIAKNLLRIFFLGLGVSVSLFLVFDFFDRIDNIASEETSISTVVQYFVLKIPLILSLMIPVSLAVSTVLTYGLMSKNSELVALRAAGLEIRFLARPLILLGTLGVIAVLVLNETIVPWSQRRSREIYNIDIRKKDEKGTYSQANLWWREGGSFYTSSFFDSRTATLLDLSSFTLSSDFDVLNRTHADSTHWVSLRLGWTMHGITEFTFAKDGQILQDKIQSLALPIPNTPEDFYDVKTDPQTLNYFQLKSYIAAQRKNGVPVAGHFADLYHKLSFPFICLVVPLVMLPFAIRHSRAGSLAGAFSSSLLVGFSYYVIHSLSISMGRAELWNPFLAAWAANILIGIVGVVLLAGAEAP